MKREARVASARTWILKFSGKNVERGYPKWFDVDLFCAVKELSLLGGALHPACVTQQKATVATRRRRQRKPSAIKLQSSEYRIESDENFAFISGRTAGGLAYSVTWEEFEVETLTENRKTSLRSADDNLPFSASEFFRITVGYALVLRAHASLSTEQQEAPLAGLHMNFVSAQRF